MSTLLKHQSIQHAKKEAQAPPRLLLFFTRGVSLRTWADVGMLEREVALYRRLRGHGVDVGFVTYGDRAEQDLASSFDGIRVLPLRGNGSDRRNFARLLFDHGGRVARADVLKTNQIPGAELAVRSKRLFRKKLIVRCGYPYSLNRRGETADRAEHELALRQERAAVVEADAVVVTTSLVRDYMLETHALPPERVVVIPNYVVTDVFRPLPNVENRYDLVTVARASAEKNHDALLGALARLKARGREVSLLLLGGCAADASLRRRAEAEGLAVTFGGNVANFELPEPLNSARAFVLPSLFEGHPKALLEAMSCGLPCIGSDVRGIRELLRHDDTGWLCGTDEESIAAAIEAVLDDADLRERIGASAREYVKARFGLDAVTALELALLREVAGQKAKQSAPVPAPHP